MGGLQPTAQSTARRQQLVDICVTLPEVEATGEPHIAFRVRKKTFAYYEFDHHGDGLVSLVCKAPPGVQQSLIDSGPERFFYPAYLGTKGWIGLCLDDERVDWIEIEWLLCTAYRLLAPKRLRVMM